jgi:hypothetical protein
VVGARRGNLVDGHSAQCRVETRPAARHSHPQCHWARREQRAHLRVAADRDRERDAGQRVGGDGPLDKYKGGVWDNRPTTLQADIEAHRTPGYAIRHARGVSLKNCGVKWEADPPEYFAHALETEHVTRLEMTRLQPDAAHPGRYPDALVA